MFGNSSGVVSSKPGGGLESAVEPSVAAVFDMRRELVGAQVDVLRLYLEKQPRERMVVALERLMDCTRATFTKEEALMELFAGTAGAQHREAHREVLAQMSRLRRDLLDFDRAQLLGRLIQLDRQLNSHHAELVDLEPETPAPTAASNPRQH